ncbi:MAG: CrcB family protein [Phycisphaerae bacterium]|nr:CrcB family protein [Phycisphaerae bacterium]
MLTALDWSLVFVGGAIGAAARYGTLRLATRLDHRASLGLFALNSLGCLLAGVFAVAFAQAGLLGLSPESTQTALIGGLLGGYTTFSAVALECATAAVGPMRRRVLIEAALSTILAAPLARLGMAIGSSIAGALA